MLRSVCRQWKDELDQFYEYTCNIYDINPKLEYFRRVRCREVVIWKLIVPIPYNSLFLHPAYLKVIKVYGPTSAENLRHLISTAINLEQLIMTRRANYPWILNMKDTPALANLKQLKLLRLTTCQHLVVTSGVIDSEELGLPMMDCYFPKLEQFEILKRYPSAQYLTFVKTILKFVARHSGSLKNLTLNLIPLTSVRSIDGTLMRLYQGENAAQGDGNVSEDDVRSAAERERQGSSLSPKDINLEGLCKLDLRYLSITTEGKEEDIFVWKEILETQKQLQELRFDWLRREPVSEVLARANGFPWIHFRQPILQCSASLVHVDLSSLSMCCGNFYYFDRKISFADITSNVLPFDLSLFRDCDKLKGLQLRCRESHCQFHGLIVGESNSPREENAEAPVSPEPEWHETLLAVNAKDLPASIESLEIVSLPMLSTDIHDMMKKLVNLRKCFLKDCGKTKNLGVSADVVREIGNLAHLSFLDIVSFNDCTEEKRKDLETVFQAIGRPFRGADTWLEFDDGRTSAHQSLKNLRPSPCTPIE